MKNTKTINDANIANAINDANANASRRIIDNIDDDALSTRIESLLRRLRDAKRAQRASQCKSIRNTLRSTCDVRLSRYVYDNNCDDATYDALIARITNDAIKLRRTNIEHDEK